MTGTAATATHTPKQTADAKGADKAPKAAKAAAPKAPKVVEDKPYPNLSGTFLRGQIDGQTASVYNDRETNKGKVEDFRKAIVAGDVKLGSTVLKKSTATKLVELGVDVPKKLVPAAEAKD